MEFNRNSNIEVANSIETTFPHNNGQYRVSWGFDLTRVMLIMSMKIQVSYKPTTTASSRASPG